MTIMLIGNKSDLTVSSRRIDIMSKTAAATLKYFPNIIVGIAVLQYLS